MKKIKKVVALPKELVKPTGINHSTNGEAIEFLCREYGNGHETCRMNHDIGNEDEILF